MTLVDFYSGLLMHVFEELISNKVIAVLPKDWRMDAVIYYIFNTQTGSFLLVLNRYGLIKFYNCTGRCEMK